MTWITEYLKTERERMDAATYFCHVCNNWSLKASHPHDKEPK